jgi:hypothetical protein
MTRGQSPSATGLSHPCCMNATLSVTGSSESTPWPQTQ